MSSPYIDRELSYNYKTSAKAILPPPTMHNRAPPTHGDARPTIYVNLAARAAGVAKPVALHLWSSGTTEVGPEALAQLFPLPRGGNNARRPAPLINAALQERGRCSGAATLHRTRQQPAALPAGLTRRLQDAELSGRPLGLMPAHHGWPASARAGEEPTCVPALH